MLNNLTGITDENGSRFADYTYDCQGRATSTAHAGGVEKATFTYNADGTTTVADYVGNPLSPTITDRKYSFQTTLGVVKMAGIVDPATGQPAPCAGCGPYRAQSYDANGNVASRTNWNGNVTTYVYDVTRNLETSRVEASGTPQARTISTQWHASFRLPTAIAEPNRRTTLGYDAQGNLASRTIQNTDDPTGASGFGSTLTGTPRTWTYTYDTNGQVRTVNGPRTDVADVTTYTYYANNDADLGKRGNIASITNALSQVTTISSYNAHGQPLTIVDPNGLTTSLGYDARQRLTSRNVGGETTAYEYDGVGQLTKVTLPDGSFLSYAYDAAHRLTQMADNLSNKIVYGLDLMGNRTLEEVRDPSNALTQTRARVFDSLNRLQQYIGALP